MVGDREGPGSKGDEKKVGGSEESYRQGGAAQRVGVQG